MTATRFPAVFSVALCLTLGSWAAAEDADKRAAKIVRQAHELKESGSFDAALELARSAVREFEVALRASPNDASCRFALAQLHHQLGESGAATEHLERALALDPNNVKMISFKGVRLFLAKKVAEGEQEFLRAIELEPKNACVRMAYATALGAIGRHEQAEVRAREAVELDPRDPDAVLFLASLVFNAKKYVEWEKTVRSGIEHRPHDTRLRGHLIDVLYVFNRFDDAYAECQKSAEVDPYDPENEMRMLNLCKFLTTPAGDIVNCCGRSC